MNLLIVEDNQQMRRVLGRLVGDLAGHVYECADGAEALAAYVAHRPDWVLMDIEMKQLDGLSATRQIVSRFPEAHVVVVTNYDDEELRDAAREAGACAYVVKENLLELRRVLGPIH
ncbi:MAG: response regulator transcription factor [Pyrinomonadaceae bacterium]